MKQYYKNFLASKTMISRPDENSPPLAYRYGGSAKEGHGQPIYCVAWNPDVFVGEESQKEECDKEEENNPDESEEAQSMEEEDSTDDETYASTITGDESESCVRPARKSPRSKAKVYVRGTRHKLKKPKIDNSNIKASRNEPLKSIVDNTPSLRKFYYFATCGSRQISLYEVDVSDQNVKSAVSPFSVRQAYVDPDEGEIFYCCVFGGKGVDPDIHSSLLHPEQENGNQEETQKTKSKATKQICKDSMNEQIPNHKQIVITPSEGNKQENNTKKPHPRKSGKRPTRFIPASINTPNKINHQGDSLVNLDLMKNYYQNLADLSSSLYTGPRLLCAAGKRGVVKVIDTTRGSLLMTLW